MAAKESNVSTVWKGSNGTQEVAAVAEPVQGLAPAGAVQHLRGREPYLQLMDDGPPSG
jgi:hypothetical protein